MTLSYNLWHYKRQQLFVDKYYDGILQRNHLSGEEIGIRMKEEGAQEFFYIANKDMRKYLIPSRIIENEEMPIKIIDTKKIAVKQRAYLLVTNYSSVKFTPLLTKTYKDFINDWCDFQHLNKDGFILWKILVDALYDLRFNIEIMTHPGFMKNSPIESHKLLLGYCECIDKPSYAKIKLFINENMRHMSLDELNEVSIDDAKDMRSYLEACCDFRPTWTNPKRAAEGVNEGAKILNLSTSILYNFPDPKLIPEKQRYQLRYFHPILGHQKISRRLFPILLQGGDHDLPACQEQFEQDSEINLVTDDEYKEFVRYIKNKLAWMQESQNESYQNRFRINNRINNNTWEKNYRTILSRIMLYADTQEEFNYWENLLYAAHKNYIEYIVAMREMK